MAAALYTHNTTTNEILLIVIAFCHEIRILIAIAIFLGFQEENSIVGLKESRPRIEVGWLEFILFFIKY